MTLHPNSYLCCRLAYRLEHLDANVIPFDANYSLPSGSQPMTDPLLAFLIKLPLALPSFCWSPTSAP
jgi:hypothetical protein